MGLFPRSVLRGVVGSDPVGWSAVGGGYTPAGRWVVEFDNGLTAFVKSADGDEAWPLRREFGVLSILEGSFFPTLLAFHDEPDRAILVIEDLSGWMWPPPYPSTTAGLFSMLDAVAVHPPPKGLPRLKKPSRPLWPGIRSDPSSFLQLGVAADGWLAAAYRGLAQAEEAFDPTGDDFVHNDIWAGNIAMSDRRCVLVDWGEAKRGSAAVDRGFLHLSLRSEAGPRPTSRFAGDASYVAWWSAQLTARLVKGPDPRLDPAITTGLNQDLRAALEWAAELLDLPPPNKS
jgi:hypothetical protein